MRILIAPLGLPMPTMGPAGRVKALAAEAVRRGHDLAVCAAMDGNLTPQMLPPETAWFTSPYPSFLGLPGPVGRVLPRLARLARLDRGAKVNSFEQVLFIGGNLSIRFVKEDVEALRRVIREFQPDLVFAEYRYQAIVSARLESVPVAGTHSFPGRADYAATPKLSRGVRGWLQAEGFGNLESVLTLLEESDPRFVASSPDLEPFPGEVIHVGPLTPHPVSPAQPDGGPQSRDAIVAYMGGGGVSPKRLAETLVRATEGGDCEIFVAAGTKSREEGRLHLAPRFDFGELLPRAAVFMNHGGQNSIMDGLLAGVPQLMVPGKVFERNYNAQSVARLGAGEMMSLEDFTPSKMREAIQRLTESDAGNNARAAGERLASLGGAAKVFDVLEGRYGGKKVVGGLRGVARLLHSAPNTISLKLVPTDQSDRYTSILI